MKKTIIIFLVAIIAVGCTKQNDNTLIKTINQANNVFDNPYAVIGQYHNEMLDSIGNTFSYSLSRIGSDDLTIDECENLVDSIFTYIVTVLSDFTDNASHYIYESQVAFEKELTIFDGDTMIERLLQESNDFDDLICKIQEEEMSIGSDISDSEVASKLLSLTIFEYSIQYWNNAYLNELSPWHNVIVSFDDGTVSKGPLGLYRKIKRWYLDHRNQFLNAAVSGGMFDYLAAKAIIKAFPAVASNIWILAAILGTSSAIGVILGWIGSNN